MTEDDARQVLGVPPSASAEELRSRYRQLLRDSHPDRSLDPNAHQTTQKIIQAFRLLVAATDSPHLSIPRRPGPTAAPDPQPAERIYASLLDEETIAVEGSKQEAFAGLVAIGHDLGDVTYLDRNNELLEILLRTVNNDTLSLVITLQGRSNGTTEAFLTVEPLDVGVKDLPTIEGLSTLIAHHLNYRRNFPAAL